jgi:hypothetical protein
MVIENEDLSKDDFIKLERSLNKLTAKVAEQVQYLEKHAGAVESLTRAIQHLETTLKKELSLESGQPSLQLKEAVNTFVDFTINPRFYQDRDLLKINAIPNKARKEFASETRNRRYTRS